MTGPVLHVQKVSGISGSEAHLLSLLPGLRQRGWDARMVVMHEGEPGADAFAGELAARGVPTEALRVRGDVDPGALARLAALVRRLRPVLVHTHLVHADLYGQAAARLARVPVRVSTKHGFNAFRSNRLFALADRAAAAGLDAQIAISAGLAAYLARVEGFAEDAFAVVHYGIDPGPEPPAYEGDEPRLVCIGRLVPIKGHEVLLRALRRARRETPGLRVDLAGAGPLEQDLRRLVGELDLADAVEFLGHVAPPQPALERALAVVVPSLGEGFGMVALEAMERGRAVVASRVGGLPELVVDGETGLLVDPGDEEALAVALVAVAADPERARRFGAAGRRRAVEEFPASRCVERTAAIYAAALDRSERRRARSASAAPARSASRKSHETR